MGFTAASTRRSTATSTVSNQAVVINSGNTAPSGTSAFTIAGAVSANTTVTIGVVTPGQSSANSTVSVSSGPTIANVQYLDANNTVITGANAVSTAGGNILVNGSNFVTNSSVYLNNSLATNTFISSSQIRVIGPAASAGNVTLMIFSPTNTGTVGPSVRYSGVPSWTTAAVSFQNGSAANVALVASSDSTLTYTLQAGSTLPTGISLISTGYLSGTATGYNTNTTGSFVLVATDQEGQAAQQTINWTVTTSDPQFNYTTLLLNGDTGNNISNAATNNTFLDSSTNNFTITRGGTATQGTFSPYSATGWSNYFNGSSDSFTTASAATALTLTSAWTIEFWVNTIQTARTDVVSPNYTYTSTGWFLLSFGYTTTGASGTIDYVETGGGAAKISGTFNRNGTWQHVALTKTGTSVRLFVNGTQIGTTYTTSQTQWCANSSGFLIGNQYGSSVWYNGYISNLRILNGTALYTSAFTPPTSPLTAIANTALLTSQNNRFIDNSTNALAITPQGSTSVQAFSPFAPSGAYSSATNGGSGYFNGSSDYIDVQHSTTQWVPANTNFTIEAWFYKTTVGSETVIMTKGWQGSPAYGEFTLYVQSNNIIRFLASTDGGSWGIDIQDTTAVVANQWYHVAVVRNGSTITLYRNGVSVGTPATNSSALYNHTGALRIGAHSTGSYFAGYISNNRFVIGSAIYTGAFTPPTAPLTAVANTVVLTSYTNGAIVDAHASNDLVTVGAALNTTTTKFGTASISFNGSSQYLSMPSNQLLNFGTGDFTVETWVYPNSLASDWFIISSTGTGGFFFGFSSTTTVGFGWGRTGTAWDYRVASTATAGTWQHVAVTRSGTSMRLFVNGVQQGTTQTISTAYDLSTTSTTVGSQGASYYLNGYIDDLRVTKGYARYTANFTAPTTAFIGQ